MRQRPGEGTSGEDPYAIVRRYLLKTAMRGLVWIVIAAVVSRVWPTQTWVWTVVAVFIGIAIGWSLLLAGSVFFSQRTREVADTGFWRWFAQNSGALLRFESDPERLSRDLAAALAAVHRGLMFELGPVVARRREFVISADGRRELFPVVQRLVAAAPPMPDWTIIAFRPPHSIDLVIEYEGTRLGPDDVRFAAEPDGDRVGLTLYVNGLTEQNKSTLGAAGFLLLDNALGEYAVETEVGFIEWRRLEENAEAADLKPFREIRGVFHRTAH